MCAVCTLLIPAILWMKSAQFSDGKALRERLHARGNDGKLLIITGDNHKQGKRAQPAFRLVGAAFGFSSIRWDPGQVDIGDFHHPARSQASYPYRQRQPNAIRSLIGCLQWFAQKQGSPVYERVLCRALWRETVSIHA